MNINVHSVIIDHLYRHATTPSHAPHGHLRPPAQLGTHASKSKVAEFGCGPPGHLQAVRHGAAILMVDGGRWWMMVGDDG